MGSNDHGPGEPDLWARCRKLIKEWRETAKQSGSSELHIVMLRACADQLEKAMRR